MNFYKRYPGDYLRDTAVLTLAEHGAYTLMLDYYMATEKPIEQPPRLYRTLRCETKLERDAVNKVIEKYWVVHGDGLINLRAAKEIERATIIRERNKKNGKLGGRPSNDY